MLMPGGDQSWAEQSQENSYRDLQMTQRKRHQWSTASTSTSVGWPTTTRRRRRFEPDIHDIMTTLTVSDATFTDQGPDVPTLDSLIDYVSKVDEACKNGQQGAGLRYCTAYQLLHCLPALRKLQDMVGLSEVKQQIVDLVLYIATRYHHRGDYLHSLVVGPPGVGKSTIIDILAELLTKLRICTRGHVIHAKADELISKWVGDTAQSVVRVFDEADGGILVIDEAYQLGGATNGGPDDKERRNSHAVECLNMFNQLLSERRHRVICVLAGYEDLIEQNVFSVNPGLKTRFAYTFRLAPYSDDELFQILTRVAVTSNWSVDRGCTDIIKKNYKRFKGQGRDIEHVFRECRIRIAVRSWRLNSFQPMVVTPELLEEAMKKLPEVKDDSDDDKKTDELPDFVKLLYN